ncbi:putative pectinesterase inhibitor domain-containing protein [Rosa chinensis]|uniref:Putative pectinesterase inhibitor domain-containing protein n=1 Tax=Rosa chinensis TaxID=74649 RepID=A0A2P6RFC5_ROSCH|nr:pectinesterase inhibitor 5 [Rosa chinensis]PRQ45115.1 putative pectinesterase inhibitor domain-containing protein [Rosa chinensis]
MASDNRSWSIVLFLALLLYYHSIVVTAADQALLDKICQLAQSYDFCLSTLRNDPRTGQADLRGLSLISIAITIDEVRDVSDRLPNIPVPNHPVDQQRKKACQTDYSDALTSFQKAYQTSAKGDYWGVIDLVRVGANKAIDCEDIYKRDPISVSPVSTDNHKVIQLAEITLIVIDFLTRH